MWHNKSNNNDVKHSRVDNYQHSSVTIHVIEGRSWMTNAMLKMVLYFRTLIKKSYFKPTSSSCQSNSFLIKYRSYQLVYQETKVIRISAKYRNLCRFWTYEVESIYQFCWRLTTLNQKIQKIYIKQIQIYQFSIQNSGRGNNISWNLFASNAALRQIDHAH